MASSNQNLQTQYIDLDDFSPGIYSDYFSSIGAYPDGAAQVNNTWGCVSGPKGGLLPGPKKIDYNIGGQFSTVNYPEQLNYDLINGFLVTPQTGLLQPSSLSGNSLPLHRACFVTVSTQCYNSNTVATSPFFQLARTMIYKPNQTISQNMGTGNRFQLGILISAASVPFDGSELNFYSSPMAISRMNNAAPTTQPGFPVMAVGQVVWPSTGAVSSYFLAFPKNTTPNVDSSEAITVGSTISPPNQIVAHQGRFIWTAWSDAFTNFSSFGGGQPFNQSSDALDYTPVNQYNVASGLTNGVVLSPEGPGGIGAITSMNASELFVVRRYAGAFSIRGDINNPQVVSLPSVVPTGIDGNTGALTPNGFVYGSTDGVFMWGGGDSSVCISDSLTGLVNPRYDNAGNFQRNGPFWREPLSNIGITGRGGSAASFTYIYPYIYAPFNWMMDTRSGGWFRFCDPAKKAYNWYGNAPDATLLAAPTAITPSQQEQFSWWDPSRGTDYYTWTSQPLARTQGRYIEAREVVLVAQGSGQITVTLIGLNGVLAQPLTFDINSPTPQLYSKTCNCIATDLVVNIQSKSSDPNTSEFVLDSTIPAPKVNRMRIGYQDNQTGRG